MKKETNALKVLAKEAKNRMKMYARSSLHNPYKTSVMSKEDCELYNKVCKILSRDNITTNPINELIDKEYYERHCYENAMTHFQPRKFVCVQQRYLFLCLLDESVEGQYKGWKHKIDGYEAEEYSLRQDKTHIQSDFEVHECQH